MRIIDHFIAGVSGGHESAGWKRSAFGEANQHGVEGVRFWTRVKTVAQTWPDGGAGDSAFIIPTMG